MANRSIDIYFNHITFHALRDTKRRPYDEATALSLSTPGHTLSVDIPATIPIAALIT